MRKGGYHIVNLKDQTLSVEAVTIKGLYNDIEGSYRKPLLLSGLVIDGVEKPDTYVTAVISDGGSITISAYGKTITVTSEDAVTIA